MQIKIKLSALPSNPECIGGLLALEMIRWLVARDLDLEADTPSRGSVSGPGARPHVPEAAFRHRLHRTEVCCRYLQVQVRVI